MRRRKSTTRAGAGALRRLILCLGLATVAVSVVSVQAATTSEAGKASRPWESYYGVAIASGGRAVIVGDKGVVITSNDQGKSWTRRQLNNSRKFYDLYSVAFTADGAHGWIVGDGGSIFQSDDRGSTWTLKPSKQSAALLKVAAIDAQKACAVGEHGTILCTSDGGTTWNLQKFEDFVFFDVAFTDSNNGWAVGEFATAVRTVDGGKTWTVQTGAQRTISADPYFAIAFDNASNGLVLGLSGTNMVTVDGGKTWKTGVVNDDSRSFYTAAPFHADDTSGYYVGGENGVMGKVIQGKMELAGKTTSNAISSFAFAPNFALGVGLYGTIMRSDDGGQHWTLIK